MTRKLRGDEFDPPAYSHPPKAPLLALALLLALGAHARADGPATDIPICAADLPVGSLCIWRGAPTCAVHDSQVADDPANYCHARYQAKQFSPLTLEGRTRLEGLCVEHQRRMK
jgi:hypothetical protein